MFVSMRDIYYNLDSTEARYLRGRLINFQVSRGYASWQLCLKLNISEPTYRKIRFFRGRLFKSVVADIERRLAYELEMDGLRE